MWAKWGSISNAKFPTVRRESRCSRGSSRAGQEVDPAMTMRRWEAWETTGQNKGCVQVKLGEIKLWRPLNGKPGSNSGGQPVRVGKSYLGAEGGMGQSFGEAEELRSCRKHLHTMWTREKCSRSPRPEAGSTADLLLRRVRPRPVRLLGADGRCWESQPFPLEPLGSITSLRTLNLELMKNYSFTNCK